MFVKVPTTLFKDTRHQEKKTKHHALDCLDAMGGAHSIFAHSIFKERI